MRERLASQEQLVDPADLASVLDYVQALFDEGQYTQAAGLWAKTYFSGEDTIHAKYYRLLALTLKEQPGLKENSRIGQAVQRAQIAKEEYIDSVIRENERLRAMCERA
jgi:hypothetical protein